MKIQTISLQAGQTYTYAVQGVYFRVLTGAATFKATFNLATGERQTTEVIGGLGFGFPVPFVSVELYSDSTQLVEIITSAQPVDDSRLSGSVSISVPAQIVDSPDVVCANSAKTTVCPANSARKAILVTNTDAASTVRVGGASVAANAGTPLQAGMTLTLEVTGEVCVWNASGAPVAVAVSEVTA